MLFLLVISLAACAETKAEPPACRMLSFDQTPFIVCSFDPQSANIRLFHTAPDGEIYGQFDRLSEVLEGEGNTLTFAMNAGMYHKDRSPVGLYVEQRELKVKIVTNEGPGNFGMLPNGVLRVDTKGVEIKESKTFQQNFHARGVPLYATQSGPMLVIDGDLHPVFNTDGTSKHRRNGVGVSADGKVHFAISEVPVNFHTFARLFRDELKTPNALYLDGKVSKVYSVELERNEIGLDMGPIVAVIE